MNQSKIIQNTQLARYQNNNWFIGLSFKTYLNNTYTNQYHCTYTNNYSYLEIIRTDITDNSIENPKIKTKFAVNTFELLQIIEKAERSLNLILNHSKELVQNTFNISSANFNHVFGENFNNVTLSTLFLFDASIKKIFVTLNYTSNNPEDSFIVFQNLPYAQYKSFIHDLKQVVNNWFNLQMSNSIYNYLLDKPNKNMENLPSETNNYTNQTQESIVSQPVVNNTVENTSQNSFFSQIEDYESTPLEIPNDVNGLSNLVSELNPNTQQDNDPVYTSTDPMELF